MATELLDAPDLDMGKSNRKPAKRQQDYLVLPPAYHAALQITKAKGGRDLTVNGQVALELFFRAIGQPFEENWTGLVNELAAKIKAHK